MKIYKVFPGFFGLIAFFHLLDAKIFQKFLKLLPHKKK